VPVEDPAFQAVLMALEMRDAIGALTETGLRNRLLGQRREIIEQPATRSAALLRAQVDLIGGG
jgi:hypothetical protein